MQRHLWYLLMALLMVLVGTACPGELDLNGYAITTQDGGGPISAPWPDLGATPSTDGGSATEDAQTPDSLAPDSLPPPDTQPPPDTTSSSVGKACPCSTGTLCISGVCRATCSAPSGACGVTSNCPTDHACLGTTAGTYVCMPAAKPGAACGTASYCPVNYVCGATGTNPYRCLPICSSSGAACGAGGKCVKASNGCMFCSSS